MKIVLMQTLVLCMFLNFYDVKTERAERIKRQNPGDALIDAVFQVPIQTLSAVGTLVKTTRPIIMQVRQRIQQSLIPRGGQPQRFSFPGYSSQQQQHANNRISSTAAYNKRHQQPTTSYNKRHQQPTANYNKLYQQPSQHRFSAGNNKFFRDGNSI